MEYLSNRIQGISSFWDMVKIQNTIIYLSLKFPTIYKLYQSVHDFIHKYEY